jgi:hypothetical protein
MVALSYDMLYFSLPEIPGGAVGAAVLYTESTRVTHVIRKVRVHMEAWINHLKP